MSGFDRIDAQILSCLQDNGRMAQVDIAKLVGLAPSAVLERIRKLEAKGVIRGYAGLVNPRAADLSLLAFIAVRTNVVGGDEDRVGEQLAEIPEVLEVHHVAGDDCFLVKIRARDPEHLGALLKANLGLIKGVRSTRTTIVLGTHKETTALPIAGSTGSTGSLS